MLFVSKTYFTFFIYRYRVGHVPVFYAFYTVAVYNADTTIKVIPAKTRSFRPGEHDVGGGGSSDVFRRNPSATVIYR